MQLVGNTIWLRVDTDKPGASIQDARTGDAPRGWRGTYIAFEVGIFYNDAPLDLSNISHLTLDIFDDARTGDSLIGGTVAAASITPSISADDWANLSASHATFTFTGDQTNLSLETAIERNLWLALAGVTTDSPGHDITYGGGVFTLEEDGTGNADRTTPEAPPNYYTANQADARFLQKHADQAWVQFHEGRWWHYIESTGLWYPEVAVIQDGVPQLTLGTGVSL